jgi:cyclic beta-1,2-glucan synthetase
MITTTLEVAVLPDDDAEVRRVSLTNLGNHERTIELTSYTELVLAPHAEDDAHPAFSKMFVETEFIADQGIILATRRPKTPGDPRIWAAHYTAIEGETIGDVEFETDRARFLGGGREIRTSVAMAKSTPLSNTCGTVLDPIFSLRRQVLIPPGATVRVSFWVWVASSRGGALDMANRHHPISAFDGIMPLALVQAQTQLDHLGISTDEAHLYQRLANSVLYSNPTVRPPSDVLKEGAGMPSMLWQFGISGDVPIVLAQIDETGDLELVRQLLLAHEFWDTKQLVVDLVILNENAPPADELQAAL